MEIVTQTLDSPSITIELRFRKKSGVETPVTETSADELTLRSVDEQIKQATDPIIRRKEVSCALLVGWTEMESAENSETSSSRHNLVSTSLSHNQEDMMTRVQRNPHRHNRLRRAATMDNLTTIDHN